MFGLSSVLLRRGVVWRLVVAFYSCEIDLDRQNRFDKSKILNYGTLKNWSYRYSGNYFIKFIGFIDLL